MRSQNSVTSRGGGMWFAETLMCMRSSTGRLGASVSEQFVRNAVDGTGSREQCQVQLQPGAIAQECGSQRAGMRALGHCQFLPGFLPSWSPK